MLRGSTQGHGGLLGRAGKPRLPHVLQEHRLLRLLLRRRLLLLLLLLLRFSRPRVRGLHISALHLVRRGDLLSLQGGPSVQKKKR